MPGTKRSPLFPTKSAAKKMQTRRRRQITILRKSVRNAAKRINAVEKSAKELSRIEKEFNEDTSKHVKHLEAYLGLIRSDFKDSEAKKKSNLLHEKYEENKIKYFQMFPDV
jgi:hypothetical protein